MERQEDDISRMPMWKSYLYHLQQQAPQPKRIVCQREVANRPAYYGREYHGAISREDADFLLTIGGQGSYLIRESLRAPGQFTLAIRFEGITKNFKLYYDGKHYVGEKRFDTVQDLVADGLITFYLESKAADYIASLSSQSNYAESPYVAYNTHKKKQLAAPRRDRHRKRGDRDGAEAGPSSSSQANRASTSGAGNTDTAPSHPAPVPPTAPAPTPGSPVLMPGPAYQRKSAANIPVETRLSQIIDGRQDRNKNIQSAGGADPKRSPQLSSSASPQQVSPGGSSAGSASPSQHEKRRRDPPVPPTAPVLPPAAREDREYQNTTINREIVRQSIMNQGGMPVGGEAAGSSGDHSDGSAERISSSTNTDGPTRSSNERRHGSKNSSHERIRQQENSPHSSQNSSHERIRSSQSSSHSQNVLHERNGSKNSSHEIIHGKNSPHASRNSSHGSRNSSVDSGNKSHQFKMFDDPHFTTPPSSPPLSYPHHPHHPHGAAAALGHMEGGPGGNSKLGSVSWCTDYLEVMGSEKPHNFKQNTFKGPHWCDFCANFLWGLIAQGVKCQDCGFNAHKKCSEKVPNDCMPDMKFVKKMFGIDLTTLVKAQNTLIPAVVEKCVQEIESRGLEHEGLYRVAGFHDDVEAIKMSFDKDGDMTDISEAAYDDINTITSVLKLYFRLLPIPLITFDIYFQVIEIVKKDQNQDLMFDALRNCLALLPPSHYHTNKYLMGHLHRVTEAKHKNMMSSENLAIVFAPTLLRSPETDPLSGLTAVKYERELIEILIMHHNVLFD